MKTSETPTTFSITFSPYELWFLIQLYAPGVILGIADPFSQLSQEEKIKVEEQARISLEQNNVIKMQGSGQYLVDDLVSGMIYSCIHSTHLVTVRDKMGGLERYFHFLPDWQLELARIGENYGLTIFKRREELWPHLLKTFKTHPVSNEKTTSFSVDERELELALFLFQNGKRGQAVKILEESSASAPVHWDTFLKSYLDPINFMSIDAIYDRNQIERTVQRIRYLIQADRALYWVVCGRSAEDDPFFLEFEPVDFSGAESRFSSLLPNSG